MPLTPKATVRRETGRVATDRQGVACVELAICSTILVILILGIIEVGQYVNIGQSVSNACREGARVAARQSTTDVSKIQSSVSNYLTKMHPGLPASAVQVTVLDGSNTLTGGGITTIPTGSPVSVQVTLQFDAVRWIRGLPMLNGRTVSYTTVTRRE